MIPHSAPASHSAPACHSGVSSNVGMSRRSGQQSSDLPAGVWRAGGLGHMPHRGVSSGFPLLDTVLPGGGWPVGCLTELICREPGIGELRLLVPLLRSLTQARRFVILLAPPLAPYAPALAGFGIDLDYLIVVQARHAADRLWAIEQSLKSAGFGALLAWLPQARTRPEHLRRLQCAAQSASGPVFLFRELPAQSEPSAAPLRLLLLPRPGQQLSVQLLKRRGPLIAQPLIVDLPQPISVFGLGESSRAAAGEAAAVPAPTHGSTPRPPSMQSLYAHPAQSESARTFAVTHHPESNLSG
jgi:protein ImuA